MKALLQALQTRIISKLTYLGGVKSVHLVPIEDALPETTPFPCVALKDGTIKTEYNSGSRDLLEVDIIPYVQIRTSDGVLIGKGTQKGVLDVEEDLKTALEKYDPSGYTWQPGVDRNPSQPGTFGEVAVQKKKITMRWIKNG